MAENYICSLQGIIDDSLLDVLIERIIGLTNDIGFDKDTPNLNKHFLAYIPTNETPFGPARNDDTTLRVSAPFIEDGKFVKFHYRKWILSYYSPAELPKPGDRKMANYRAVYDHKVQGDVFTFLEMLEYKFAFEYVLKGYTFRYGDVVIEIAKIYQLESQHLTSSAKVMPFTEKRWMVELSSNSKVSNENVPKSSDQLYQFASYLKGIVDVARVDHVALNHKIKYNQI